MSYTTVTRQHWDAALRAAYKALYNVEPKEIKIIDRRECIYEARGVKATMRRAYRGTGQQIFVDFDDGTSFEYVID